MYIKLVKEYGGDIDEVARELNKKPAEIRRIISTQGLREDILVQTRGILDKQTRETVERLLPTLKDDRKGAQSKS